MANTRFGYVRQYELSDALLPGTFLVVRLDGKGFHRFSDAHGFEKPNDRAALDLINAAACRTMENETLRQHVLLAFGESDEYSFLLGPRCTLFGRRNSKILSTFVSIFTASYVLLWNRYLPNKSLDPAGPGPSFDGRIVVYPGVQEVKDYFKWRQADTHINNLYNTVYWTLIQQGGLTGPEAHKKLSGTVSSEKNELLFSTYGINYSKLDPMFRKGSLIVWNLDVPEAEATASTTSKKASQVERRLAIVHEDMLKDSWWTNVRPNILLGVQGDHVAAASLSFEDAVEGMESQ